MQSIGYNNQKTNVIGPEFKTSEKSAGTGLDKPLISIPFTLKKKRLPQVVELKNKTKPSFLIF